MKNRSLTQGDTSVSIILPVIRIEYDPVTNMHKWLISWGEAEKQIAWRNDYFRYSPEKVADALNETLKELCAKGKPFSIKTPS